MPKPTKSALKELPNLYDLQFSGKATETIEASAPAVGSNPYCMAPAPTETGSSKLSWDIKWSSVLLGQHRGRSDGGASETGDGDSDLHEKSGCVNAEIPVKPTNKDCSSKIEGAGGSFLRAPSYLSDYVLGSNHVLTFAIAAALPRTTAAASRCASRTPAKV